MNTNSWSNEYKITSSKTDSDHLCSIDDSCIYAKHKLHTVQKAKVYLKFSYMPVVSMSMPIKRSFIYIYVF